VEDDDGNGYLNIEEYINVLPLGTLQNRLQTG
jgi:hypothetical protein